MAYFDETAGSLFFSYHTPVRFSVVQSNYHSEFKRNNIKHLDSYKGQSCWLLPAMGNSIAECIITFFLYGNIDIYGAQYLSALDEGIENSDCVQSCLIHLQCDSTE